ncbi:ABC transporter ATP-binding protein [Hoeflea sp.]|uniref:ABC transporter ATP-binding protein n=1 Tax=Hoeflea sp. TaxID=1940281 RepID=UPI003B017745
MSSETSMNNPADLAFVTMEGITKRFGPEVLANDSVDFDVRKGEVHAILGENGAGKSTLMNILYGVYEPTEGCMNLDGVPVEFKNPSDAINAGIGMIHQEFMLVEPFTVAENLVMGTTELPAGAENLRSAARQITLISKEYGLHVFPDARIEGLTVGERQRVEILKLLFRHAQLLILDEPTAVLTPQETDSFFDVLRKLRDRGKSIVIVTHKLHEVMSISDRVSVMRDGRLIETVDTASTSEEELVKAMVGRDVDLKVDRRTPPGKDVALRIRNLVVPHRLGEKKHPPVNLDIHAGEILGIAGVDGNGQTEFIETIFGLLEEEGGEIHLFGDDLSGKSCFERRHLGLGYIPADRRKVGSLVTSSIEDNVILGASSEFSRRGILDRAVARQKADEVILRFGVKAPGPHFTAGKLSGGNLQKLVLGREVSRNPRCLLIEQPSRGLDVGAIQNVWREIIDQRNQGTAILLASTELEEVMALSDRIAVMFEGQFMGIVPADEAHPEMLGRMMAGRHLSELFETTA